MIFCCSDDRKAQRIIFKPLPVRLTEGRIIFQARRSPRFSGGINLDRKGVVALTHIGNVNKAVSSMQ